MIAVIGIFLQILILKPDFSVTKLPLIPVDTSVTTPLLFQNQEPDAPYAADRDSVMIAKSLYRYHSRSKPVNTSFSGTPQMWKDVMQVRTYYDVKSNTKYNFENVNLSYNVISGQAYLGINLISTRNTKLKLGMNLSYDYFRLNSVQMLSLFGRSTAFDPNQRDENQVTLTYHFRNLDIKSKYEPALFQFNESEDLTLSDKFSIVLLFTF